MRYPECSAHLFLFCPFSSKIWNWFIAGTDQLLDLSGWSALLHSSLGSSNELVRLVMNAAIVQTVWILWVERNNRIFQGKVNSAESLIHKLIAEVKMSFKVMLLKSHDSVAEFKIRHLFGLSYSPPVLSVSRSVVVRWIPPVHGCVKINVDGSAFGAPPSGAIGGVCRNGQTQFVGGFAQNIGHATSLEAEFCAVMFGIEKAAELNWNYFQVESDSIAVVKAFEDPSKVPWQLKIRWLNCLTISKQLHCSCVHILREGNSAADAMAKNAQGLPCYTTQWWDSPPLFVIPILVKDSSG